MGRLVIQQCLSASLKLPGADGKDPEHVDVRPSTVVLSSVWILAYLDYL